MFWIGIIVGALLTSIFFYRFFIGRPASAFWLNTKMIYQVSGQVVTTQDKNIVVIENAKGEVRCIKSPPLSSKTHFAKNTDSSGKWRLVSTDDVDKPVEEKTEQ